MKTMRVEASNMCSCYDYYGTICYAICGELTPGGKVMLNVESAVEKWLLPILEIRESSPGANAMKHFRVMSYE